MKLNIFLLIILCFSFISCQKLIMIQELFRHGARYPVYPKNDDMSNYTFAEHSFGQLTTNGKKMHYLLGNKIYNLYWKELFGNTNYNNQYNQSKFYIKSTDVNRTIQSVQSHMMGILENLPQLNITDDMRQFSSPQWPDVNVNTGYVFPGAAKFHPIAIHVQKVGTNPYSKGDFLRTYSPQNCPKQNQWEKQNQQNQRVKQIANDKRFKAALQVLSKELGKNISFFQSPAYYDNYQSAKYLGRQYLNVFKNKDYAYALDYIHTLEMYINLYMNKKQISSTATGFFNQTVRNIKKIIANKEQVQWNIYSAHDTTVGNMLAALNFTNIQCIYDAFLKNKTSNSQKCVNIYPLYTSNIIFELYEFTNNNTHYIQIRYNGQLRQIPFCNYELTCPVEKFYQWYQEFKDQNWLSNCGIVDQQRQQKQKYFALATAQFGILLTVGLYFVVKYLKKQKKNSTKKQQSKKQTSSLSNKSNDMIKQSLLSQQKTSLSQQK